MSKYMPKLQVHGLRMSVWPSMLGLAATVLLVAALTPSASQGQMDPDRRSPVDAHAAVSGDNYPGSFSEFAAQMPADTWVQLPGTRLKNALPDSAFEDPVAGIIGPKGIITAWNGAVWIEEQQRMDIIAAGGHADYCGNQYMSFDLDHMRWVMIHGPSSMAGYDFRKGRSAKGSGVMSDGKPASRHTYQMQVYHPGERKTYLFGGSICSAPGTADSKWWRVSLNGDYELVHDTGRWERLGGHGLYDPVTDSLYMARRDEVFRYDLDMVPPRKTQISSTKTRYPGSLATSAAIDVDRRTILGFGGGASWTLNLDRRFMSQIRPTGDFSIINRYGIGLVYVKKYDRYVGYDYGSTVYFIDPETWHISSLELEGTAPEQLKNGTFGRFAYSQKHDAFLLVSRYDQNVYTFRISELPPESPDIGELRFDDLRELMRRAPEGGTLTIPGGIYLQGLLINKPLTVNLAGVELWGVHGQKAVVTVDKTTGPVTINGLQVDGRKSNAVWSNLAGIRVSGQNFDVTVNRANIGHTVMGIMTDNRGGKLTINDSFLHDTGSHRKTALSHVIYAGEIDELTINNSRIARSNSLGHLVKSRARSTLINHSELVGGNSRHSRLVDLPCGGELQLRHSQLLQSPRSDNAELLGLALEKCGAGRSTAVSLEGTSFVGRHPTPRLSREKSAVQWTDRGGNQFDNVRPPFH